LETVDILADGFPGIARLRILADWKTGALLNACLNQPIVITTHHQDAEGGLHLYEEAANFVNSLGSIRWCDLDTMAKAFFQTRTNCRTMEARVFARRTAVSVASANVEELLVRPMWEGGAKGVQAWGDDGKPLSVAEIDGQSVRIQVKGQQNVAVQCAASGLVDYKTVPAPRLRPWAYFRRALTATRDRVRPFLVGDRKKNHSLRPSGVPVAANLTKDLEEHEFLQRETGH
jgi:hypothetical protein